jgi:hypothetical protein
MNDRFGVVNSGYRETGNGRTETLLLCVPASLRDRLSQVTQ